MRDPFNWSEATVGVYNISNISSQLCLILPRTFTTRHGELALDALCTFYAAEHNCSLGRLELPCGGAQTPVFDRL